MKLLASFMRSKTRKNLLLLFFSNPEKKYYLHEISRLIGYPAQNIRRELSPLVKDGLFIKELVGNLTFYYLNQSHPLYPELKSIISKTIGIEALLQESLKKVVGIQTAFIYGSYAQGKELGNSDIDLFILGKPNKDMLTKKISELEKKIGREVNTVFYSKETFQKKKKEHNSFIDSISKNPKIFLIGQKHDLER